LLVIEKRLDRLSGQTLGKGFEPILPARLIADNFVEPVTQTIAASAWALGSRRSPPRVNVRI
jgi:hypothetical protein